jgi:allantoinase
VIFRGNRVLVDGVLRPAAVHVAGGRIAAVGRPEEIPPGEDIRDVGDLLLTPGIVDSHVHVNEPGRTEWEGFETATQAAAAGGITTVVDMPLNCIPATIDRPAAETKRLALRDQLHVDAVFWGGVIPGNTGALADLARFGVPGAKCFTCPSGVDEFPHVSEADLDRALPVLRDLGLTLLVHAEAPGPLAVAERAVESEDPREYATYLRSRPATAEDQAIAMVIRLARKHRAAVHIVHLSSASAILLLRAAQAEGVRITAETCLHYLTFTAEEIPAGDTRYKCAPPIRERANREALWAGLREGVISMVVSDHSPCTPQLKRPETGDFLGAWGGIAGLQLGLSALWTEARERGHGLAEMFRWNAEGPARLAGLADRKGRIAPGFDADLVIWDDAAAFTVDPGAIRHRHKVTPWAGRALFGRVEETWVGGAQAWSRTAGLSRPIGRFVAVSR